MTGKKISANAMNTATATSIIGYQSGSIAHEIRIIQTRINQIETLSQGGNYTGNANTDIAELQTILNDLQDEELRIHSVKTAALRNAAAGFHK